MPTLPCTRLASTGTPQVTASTTTLAPPSITLEIIIACASRIQRRVCGCVRLPSQRYRWLGSLTHPQTRRWIRDAHAMVISSVMEGGANVVVEAVTCGVPVLASRVQGNVGMLGPDYDGYFPAGDDEALARLIDRASREPDFLLRLRGQ